MTFEEWMKEKGLDHPTLWRDISHWSCCDTGEKALKVIWDAAQAAALEEFAEKYGNYSDGCGCCSSTHLYQELKGESYWSRNDNQS